MIVGWLLARAAAAVTAYGGYEKGGVVPETELALVHKGEMILPEHISRSVQQGRGSAR